MRQIEWRVCWLVAIASSASEPLRSAVDLCETSCLLGDEEQTSLLQVQLALSQTEKKETAGREAVWSAGNASIPAARPPTPRDRGHALLQERGTHAQLHGARGYQPYIDSWFPSSIDWFLLYMFLPFCIFVAVAMVCYATMLGQGGFFEDCLGFDKINVCTFRTTDDPVFWDNEYKKEYKKVERMGVPHSQDLPYVNVNPAQANVSADPFMSGNNPWFAGQAKPPIVTLEAAAGSSSPAASSAGAAAAAVLNSDPFLSGGVSKKQLAKGSAYSRIAYDLYDAYGAARASGKK